MTPQEKQQFEEMKQTLQRIDNGFRNLSQIDPQYLASILAIAKTLKINDLNDVDTTGVNNGEVLKYVSSSETWEPAPDIDT